MFKKFTFFALILCLISCATDDTTNEVRFPENIFVGNVVLNTQMQLDTFGQNDYTVVQGSLRIGLPYAEDDIVDLTPLQSLREVNNGRLAIAASQLTSLEGLNNLQTVNGLWVETSYKLINFNGLDNLQFIGGNLNAIQGFVVDLNPELISFEGLESLQGVYADFVFGNNHKLENLNGLQNLFEVGGVIKSYTSSCNGPSSDIFCGNSNLRDFCGLENLLSNGNYGEVEIYENEYNPSVQDIINGRCGN